MDHEPAKQCKSAVGALRGGFVGPAQSHAANVIESVIFYILGKKRQQIVKRQSETPTRNCLHSKKESGWFSHHLQTPISTGVETATM